MPENPVTDPITNQEIAFVHLILSGTMNDRKAAKAVGLNPNTAAYIKSKPRVQEYMAEHREAVKKKLVGQEADGPRNRNIGRDQILARLWDLAGVSPETTRGSIAGQIKAISMIVAIEGLIPAGRASSVPAQLMRAMFPSLRSQSRTQVTESDHALETQPAIPHVPDPSPGLPQESPTPSANRVQASLANPFIHPKEIDRVFETLEPSYDINLNPNLTLSIPPGIGARAHGR